MNTMKHYLRYCAPLCTITLLSHAVLFGNEEPSEEQPIYQLEDFVVSAGPVARSVDDFASPFSSLDSEEIKQNSGSSIGELLEGQPGVSSTSFAGGASRPIIRGFDGARVRILDSGIEALDASSISVDHAVATEPLLLERVEILRGPSTLLYGSSAIGGVVNMISREIPRSPVSKAGEVEGGFKTSYDSASSGETALGYIKAGGEDWAMSVTGLTRDNNDYEIPGHAESAPEVGEEATGILENSFVETDSYSIGNTWFFKEGSYFGLSYSNYNSLYGVPGHAHGGHGTAAPAAPAAPTIVDLERKRYDAELALIEPLDWIKAARVRFGRTDYMHVESEGDHATKYDNEGWELRGEIAHDSFASFDEGVVGIQFADSDFSAKGEEAFTPDSSTQNQAIFISEHIHNGDLHWEFGARVENQTVDPDDQAVDPAGQPRNLSGYSDTALGLAVSAIWNFAENQSLALSLQRSQRHPSSTELYALGAHIATDQYEFGDPNLGLETAYGIDLRHNYSEGNWSTAVSAFYTTFDDYIYSRNLGTETEIEDDDGDVTHFDNYVFGAVDSLFWGFEAEANYIAYQSVGTTVTIGLLADYVRATNEDANTNLPRITPMRIGGKLRIENGPWVVGALLRQNFKQSNNAAHEDESETASFTELQIDLSHSFELEGGELTLFAQGRNLLNEDIRRHTSFTKEEAPQPGSSVHVGLSYKF